MAERTDGQDTEKHGWTAVSRSQAKIMATLGNLRLAEFVPEDIKLPDSDMAKKTYEYAKKELPTHTFNHSMRVYYYGTYAPSFLHPRCSTTYKCPEVPRIKSSGGMNATHPPSLEMHH